MIGFWSEATVRRWVARVPCKIIWNEPGRGGTDGNADADFILPDGRSVPVELKCWKVSKTYGSFLAEMRREQVRFHYVMNNSGRKTLILWGSPDRDGIFTLPGLMAPRQVKARIERYKCCHYEIHEQPRLLADIISGRSWDEEQHFLKLPAKD